MGNGTKVTTRTFTVQEGMTPEDVMKSPNATAQQKKMAPVFDADGVKGYSQREANVFNATIISDHGKGGVSLWTKYADGTRKETLVKGDLKAFKYAPEGEIRPTAYKNSGKPTTRTIKNDKQETSYVTDKKSNLKYPADYMRREVGKGGIVSADTTYYTGTNKPEIIFYKDKNKQAQICEAFNAKGQFDHCIVFEGEKKNGFREYTTYNSKGRKEDEAFFLEGNEFYVAHHGDDKNPEHITSSEKYDVKTGRLKEVYDGADRYIYNADGTCTTKDYENNEYVLKTSNSKNQLLNEKHFDLNDVLKYTVVPKRNKEGDVIKNDTIWNRQK